MKITHQIVVTLFLLIYLIKTLLLLINKKEGLLTFSKIVKIPEMVISFLFLITGGYMLMQKDNIESFMIIKLVFVFASIPIAVIGFKKHNKALAVLSLLLIILAYGFAEMSKKKEIQADSEKISSPSSVNGKEIYSAYCTRCHGEDGRLGSSGATDLSVSKLDHSLSTDIIKRGKGMMPGFEEQISSEQIEAVAIYIESIRH